MLLLLAWQDVPVQSAVTYLAYLVLVIWIPGRMLWSWVVSRANAPGSVRETVLERWVGGAALPAMQSKSSPTRLPDRPVIRGSISFFLQELCS